MRLTGAVRRSQNIKTPKPVNSIYKPIERPENRKFNPLRVPKSLQAQLPFASKPKLMKAQKKKTYMNQRAVVMEKDERTAVALLQQMKAVQKDKTKKRLVQKSFDLMTSKLKVLLFFFLDDLTFSPLLSLAGKTSKPKEEKNVKRN